VGDRFYLCDNKILCEYDYEERLVFANMAYNPSSLAHIRRQVSNLQVCPRPRNGLSINIQTHMQDATSSLPETFKHSSSSTRTHSVRHYLDDEDDDHDHDDDDHHHHSSTWWVLAFLDYALNKEGSN